MTFGIPPTRPETGYGYIKQGAPLDDQGRVYRAARFIEKPPLDRAREFVAAGGYYWNSGIFVFRRDILLAAFPVICRTCTGNWPGLSQGDRPPLAEIYRECPSISLDHGILEKAENLAVVPVEMGWNDVGTWEALHEIFPRDKRAMLSGPGEDQDSKGCIFFAQNRLVATIGLERIIVVDTPDATLVCHRARAQEVKDLVAELPRQHMVESVQHTTVERPWGRYVVMDEGPGFKVKRIEVDPGNKLSLQVHQHRAEHWVVVTGTARVTIGQDISWWGATKAFTSP